VISKGWCNGDDASWTSWGNAPLPRSRTGGMLPENLTCVLKVHATHEHASVQTRGRRVPLQPAPLLVWGAASGHEGSCGGESISTRERDLWDDVVGPPEYITLQGQWMPPTTLKIAHDHGWPSHLLPSVHARPWAPLTANEHWSPRQPNLRQP
jgi:hypothetical protein